MFLLNTNKADRRQGDHGEGSREDSETWGGGPGPGTDCRLLIKRRVTESPEQGQTNRQQGSEPAGKEGIIKGSEGGDSITPVGRPEPEWGMGWATAGRQELER